MDQTEFHSVVANAMLAPSAHNTQPARWSLRDGGIEILADLSRRLPIGDPTDRDLEVSCGAAVEATVLALAAHGVGGNVTLLTAPDENGLHPIARVMPGGEVNPEDAALAAQMGQRLTHRAGFAPTGSTAFQNWQADHMTLVTAQEQIDWLAAQIDIASARVMQSKPFRTELLSWMRLRKDSVGYDRDGLNREVLAMGGTTAKIVPAILGTGLFDLLSLLGLGPSLSGEAARSRGAAAMALFHWPANELNVDAGRAFYRSWLLASARGLVGWPAAALADDAATRKAVSDRFAIPKDRVLFNTLRLGVANGTTPSRTRLFLRDVIV
ncbi:hypothetical protein [Ruegeria meonggei]|uniref:hypothetical protein n=1 Tax=Ruegeria meonggei TaxID=1446476 RepID=UPI00366AB113